MTEPMSLRARAAAPVKEVHRALTDADALRVWLAEYAEVELPHRYEFWGRYTPEGDAPHQRLLHVDDHTLRFTWLVDGEETTTEISLEEESADSTAITLTQTHVNFDEALADTIRGALSTFWSLAIANLVEYLEGRELTPKTDFTSSELRFEVRIDAPVDAVYDALTDSAKFTRWFGYPAEIEPHVGGRFAMGSIEENPHPARIVELVPGRSMSMDWGGGFGVVSWELDGSGGGTRLTFVQSGFDSEHPPYAGWMGWIAGVAELRRFHEVPDWRPIWISFHLPGGPKVVYAPDGSPQLFAEND